MKLFLKICLILVPLFGSSQNTKFTDILISKADLDKAVTINDIIPTFPKDNIGLFEITCKANGKPMVVKLNSAQNDLIEQTRNTIKNADTGTYVFVDLQYKGEPLAYRVKLKK